MCGEEGKRDIVAESFCITVEDRVAEEQIRIKEDRKKRRWKK